MGGGHEAAQPTDSNDQPAFVKAGDLTVDDFLFGKHALHVFPGHLLLGTLERKHDIAIVIFGVDNIDRDGLTHGQRGALFGGQRLQVTAGDHTLRLGSNAYKDLARADTCNHAMSNLPRLGQFDAGRFLKQCLHALGIVVISLIHVQVCGPLPIQGFILFHH